MPQVPDTINEMTAERLIAILENVTPADFRARPHSCLLESTCPGGVGLVVCRVCGSIGALRLVSFRPQLHHWV